MSACASECNCLVLSNTELVISLRVKRCSHQPSSPRSFSSTFSVTPEVRAISPERPPPLPRFIRIITSGLRLMLIPLFAILSLITYAWKQSLSKLSIAASVLFWICPIGVLKMIGHAISSKIKKKPRTVLISGGSSVQALHLARNLHSAGARVVAFEIEGQFALLKCSTAVHKFYTVPRLNPADPEAYARALREIVERESVVFYVPVSSTTPAYYDAVAKLHLEVLGCQCFEPRAREFVTLDDPLELMRVCRAAGLGSGWWPATKMFLRGTIAELLRREDVTVHAEPETYCGLSCLKRKHNLDAHGKSVQKNHGLLFGNQWESGL